MFSLSNFVFSPPIRKPVSVIFPLLPLIFPRRAYPYISLPLPVVSRFPSPPLVVFVLGSVFSLGYIHNPTCTTTNDPYVSSIFFLFFSSFPPRLCLLAPSCVGGCVAMKSLFLYFQINDMKRSRLLLLISRCFPVRLEVKCLCEQRYFNF